MDEKRGWVSSGIHSRRTAAVFLDVADPDAEWQRCRTNNGVSESVA